jgi:hypothetical protein
LKGHGWEAVVEDLEKLLKKEEGRIAALGG